MSKKISELDELAAADVDAADVIAIVDDSAGQTKRVSLLDVALGAISENPFLSKAIAEPFAVWDHITGAPVPDNSGDAKFIRLTAGQSGVGGYNEGLLTDEQVSGSAPLVEADAEIVVGPMAGQRVPLINTEMSFIRPGTDSGALQFDQMQRITGFVRSRNLTSNQNATQEGALSQTDPEGNNAPNSGTGAYIGIRFDSGDSPNARVSDTTAGETRSKNRQATYYMRVV